MDKEVEDLRILSMHDLTLKKNAAKLSLFSNLLLIIIKLSAGIASTSFGIMSEAIHSATDCLASCIAYFAVKKSSELPDKRHQFGHGKYEDFSGLVEGILIIFAALYILIEAVHKIITGNYSVSNINLAASVMFLSVTVNIIVSKVLFNIARKTGSIALYADGEHLRTDVYTSLGIALGMLVIKYTGMYILDTIIAFIVSIIIFNAGRKICIKTIKNLLDEGLPEKDICLIKQIVKDFQKDGILEHCLIKTRTSGPLINIELTIYALPTMTIKEGHRICNEIECKIKKNLGRTETLIHIEPESDVKIS